MVVDCVTDKKRREVTILSVFYGLKNYSLSRNWFGELIFCHEKISNQRFFPLLVDEVINNFTLCYFLRFASLRIRCKHSLNHSVFEGYAFFLILQMEFEAVNRILIIAKQVNCPVFFLHVTGQKALDCISKARVSGILTHTGVARNFDWEESKMKYLVTLVWRRNNDDVTEMTS